MINQNFVILGALIFFFGSIPYFLETLQGKVQPNKVTWFLWSLAPLITSFAEYKQGVGIQSLLPFIAGFTPLLIFFASFINKKAYWKIERFDVICGSLSIIGLILWYITGVGNIAIIFSILADFLAAVPTIRKSFTNPETENYVIYLTAALSAAITILTIKNWNFQTAGFPIYYFFLASSFTLLLKFKIGKRISG